MFAENLVESRTKPMELRRAAVLPLVAGAHAALAGALVLASAWSLQYAAEPPILYVPSIPVKLMPPPGPGTRSQDSPPKRPNPTSAAQVTPMIIPTTDPVIYSVDLPIDATGDGVDGSVGDLFAGEGGGGEMFGVPFGVEVPHPPEPDRGPVAIGGDIQAPVRLTPLAPVYPEAARKAGLQGTIMLRLIIDREGEVSGIMTLSGLPFGLTQAAEEAARRLRFKPAFRASTGQPVECFFDLSVEFRIR